MGVCEGGAEDLVVQLPRNQRPALWVPKEPRTKQQSAQGIQKREKRGRDNVKPHAMDLKNKVGPALEKKVMELAFFWKSVLDRWSY